MQSIQFQGTNRMPFTETENPDEKKQSSVAGRWFSL